jgi:hypothetical protein
LAAASKVPPLPNFGNRLGGGFVGRISWLILRVSLASYCALSVL